VATFCIHCCTKVHESPGMLGAKVFSLVLIPGMTRTSQRINLGKYSHDRTVVFGAPRI
jgi:hypothetical protein